MDGPAADLTEAPAPDAPVDVAADIGARSYTATAELVQGEPLSFFTADPPPRYWFTVHMDPANARLVAGLDGETVTVPLKLDGGAWSITAPFSLPANAVMSTYCQGKGTRSVRYETLVFKDRPDAFDGTVAGRYEGYRERDILYSARFGGTLAGSRDVTPPTLAFGSLTGAPFVRAHPFDPISARAGEPLPPATGVTIVAPSGPSLLLGSAGTAEAVARFTGSFVLGFGTSYDAVVAPAFVDLDGNAGAPPSFITIDDPGFLADGGFEGEINAYLSGGWKAIDESGALPPIAGKRSLLLPPRVGGRLTARMHVPAGAKQVRLTIRQVSLDPPDGVYFEGTIRVGAPSGKPVEVPHPEPVGPFEEMEGEPFSTWTVSAPAPVEIPLPTGTTDEVDIDIEEFTPCHPSAPRTGLLIDDLRVE